MAAFRVVEEFDAIEHITPRFFAADVDFAPDSFALEPFEEALYHRVVVAVAAPAHTGAQVVRTQEGLPVVAAVLTSLIGMHDDGARRIASPDRHQQGIERQVTIHARLH